MWRVGYNPGATPCGLPSHTHPMSSPVGLGLQLQLLHFALLPRSQALTQIQQTPGHALSSCTRAGTATADLSEQVPL